MNVICWNYNGTDAKGFSKFFNNLMQKYQFSLCFLLEMHAPKQKAEVII